MSKTLKEQLEAAGAKEELRLPNRHERRRARALEKERHGNRPQLGRQQTKLADEEVQMGRKPSRKVIRRG